MVRRKKLDHLRKHRRDHRHVGAAWNLYGPDIETSSLKPCLFGKRPFAVERDIHGASGDDARNPPERIPGAAR